MRSFSIQNFRLLCNLYLRKWPTSLSLRTEENTRKREKWTWKPRYGTHKETVIWPLSLSFMEDNTNSRRGVCVPSCHCCLCSSYVKRKGGPQRKQSLRSVFQNRKAREIWSHKASVPKGTRTGWKCEQQTYVYGPGCFMYKTVAT